MTQRASETQHQKTLLIFATDFPPIALVGSLRVAKLCNGLAQQGWRVVVITVQPRSATRIRDAVSGGCLPPLEYALHPGVEIIRLPALNPFALARPGSSEESEHLLVRQTRPREKRRFRPLAARFLNRILVPDEYVTWIPGAYRAGRKVVEGGHVRAVIGSYPTGSAAVTATLAASRLGLPLVLDFRDRWMAWGPGMSSGPIRRQIERVMESHCIKRTTLVTVVSEPMGENLAREFHSIRNAWTLVPQGWDPEEARAFESRLPASSEDGILRILHGGSTTPDLANPSVVIRALSSLINESKIDGSRVRMTFLGNDQTDITSLADSLGLNQVVTREAHLPRNTVLKRFSEADVLLVVRTGAGTEWITGKLWDYLTVRRPILAVVEPRSALAVTVERTKTGRVANPADQVDVERALLEIWAAFGSASLGVDCDNSELEKLSVPRIFERLAQQLDNLPQTGVLSPH